MAEFKSSHRIEGSVLCVSLAGPIDEDTSFPKLDASGVSAMRLNLSGVKSINSVGIREWLDWIRPLSEKLQITLEECPKALVFQFNMVEGFLPPRSIVSSFQVPFFCKKCDREQDFLFTVGKEVVAQAGKLAFKFDPKAAASCNEVECEMQPDVTEAKYFQFLTKS